MCTRSVLATSVLGASRPGERLSWVDSEGRAWSSSHVQEVTGGPV